MCNVTGIVVQWHMPLHVMQTVCIPVLLGLLLIALCSYEAYILTYSSHI